MKNKLLTIGVVAAIALFTGLGIYGAIHNTQVIKSKNIEIESKTFKLQKLETEFKQLNADYTEESNKKDQDQQKLKEYEERMQQMQKDYEALKVSKAAEKAERDRIATAQSKISNVIAPKASAASIGGGRDEWLIAAGIPQSDWQYVDCVINGCQGVSAEGGWGGTTRWNTAGSGAYGLCQALPASKMASAGADYMTNPVTQLKWCHSYAQGYGGWANAWQFRKCVGSCYSPRTNSTVSKDHTWW